MLSPRRVVLVSCSVLMIACAEGPSDETPLGAAELFVDALVQAPTSSEARRELTELLTSESRRALEQRARSTTALSAREFEAWEMIVQGRPLHRFRPRASGAYRVRAGDDPDSAIVTVFGETEGQSAELRLRREDERWRVVVEIGTRE